MSQGRTIFMKTLAEEINEVMNAKGTKAYKRVMLKGLGLVENDIRVLFKIKDREDAANAPEPRVRVHREPTFNQLVGKMTFGVEIECFNVIRDELCVVAREKGLQMRNESYNHTDNKRYFKLVSDGSIHGENPAECVTPVLGGSASGFKKLQACCESLNQVGARVNTTTGLHVHVGYANMTDEHYVRVFKNYQMLESLIDSFMARSRRENNAYYAQSIKRFYFHDGYTKQTICSQMNSRYFKVNPQSWSRHHTIEFRQHQGTTDYEKISMWVKFCLKLVLWSKGNTFTSEVNDIKDVPFLSAAEKNFFKSRIERFATAA